MTNTLPPVFCAIDTDDMDRAKLLVKELSSAGCGIKLGLEFFNRFGPQGIKDVIAGQDIAVFLDLKYHDIPNTVAGAVRAVSSLDVQYLNVHAAGGADMMRAAKEACAPETRLLAVTILTSLDKDALDEIGYQNDVAMQVKKMALLAQDSGLDGVVCSAKEVAMLRDACGDDFILMVPGIRPAGAALGDQKRVMTPADAMAVGATHLVIGRPITGADNPAQAAAEILTSLTSGQKA